MDRGFETGDCRYASCMRAGRRAELNVHRLLVSSVPKKESPLITQYDLYRCTSRFPVLQNNARAGSSNIAANITPFKTELRSQLRSCLVPPHGNRSTINIPLSSPRTCGRGRLGSSGSDGIVGAVVERKITASSVSLQRQEHAITVS